MDWVRSILFFFTRKPSVLSDAQITERYKRAGAVFGDAVSYIYMGECIGFADLLATWEALEAEWARRGFRTHSIDEFIGLGGYNTPLKAFPSKRGDGEEPVFHARIYRDEYLGKIPAVAPIGKMMQGPVVASYVLPSTELRPPDQGPYRDD